MSGVGLSINYEIARMLEQGGGASVNLLVGRWRKLIPGIGMLCGLETTP